MTDPYSSPRYPTDPVEPTTPAGYGAVPPAPPAHSLGTTDDSALDGAAVGGRRFEDGTSQDEGSSHDGHDDGAGSADSAASAKDAAGSVLDAEKTMAHDTAAEAADRAKETLAEAKTQVKDLWAQSRTELAEGAGVQLQRLSVGARTVSDELSTMASASDDPGIASDLARRASGYLSAASSWLEDRGPDEVLADVSRFARRSPGTFLAIAAGLGLVAGRVARSLRDDSADSADTDSAGGTSGSSETSGAGAAADGHGTFPRTSAYSTAPAAPTTSADGYPSTGYAAGATTQSGYSTDAGYGSEPATGDAPRTAGHVPTSSQPGATSLDGGELR